MHLPPPKAALTYGTYCDLETTLRFILTGKAVEGGTEISVEPDRWGQVIFFYNYLDHVPGTFDQEQVRAVLNYYVQDLVDEGEAARSTLSGEERRVLDLFLTPSNPESTRLAEKVLQHTRPLLEELSPSKFYSRIDFPVWVLHGSHDSMVPCTEAMALKRLLPRQVRLYLTGLYSHKELGYRGHLWQTVKDALGLIVYFGRFLRAVEG